MVVVLLAAAIRSRAPAHDNGYLLLRQMLVMRLSRNLTKAHKEAWLLLTA
jgi:hypothetical protein